MGVERICTHIRIESDHRMEVFFRLYASSILTYGRLLESSRVTDMCVISMSTIFIHIYIYIYGSFLLLACDPYNFAVPMHSCVNTY